ITLSGIVTDNPIVNASVMVRVADAAFDDAPPTGSNGEFQLDISSTTPDALVAAEALDAVNGVKLTAILDSYANFTAQARNGVVDGVKITNVTTAAQVLAEQLAADGAVDTVEEYRSLMEQIDAESLYELAAAIKVVVENIGGNVLPSGVQDTAELARAIASGDSSFLADLAVSSPEALTEARTKLLNDGNATIPFDVTSAPGVYSAIQESFTYAVFENGTALVDYGDDSSVPGTPAWSLNQNGQIDVRFFGFERATDRISAIGQVDNVMQIVTEADFGNAQVVEAASVHKVSFGAAFTSAEVPGTWIDGTMETSRWVFETSGLGYRLNISNQTQEEVFSWSVTADGRISLAFDGSDETMQFKRVDSGADDVLVIRRFGGQFALLNFSTLTPDAS
ncbi:MAG: hypothetical protein AAFU65_09150, partial [Pseudomonadota bacterium]